MDYTQSNSFVVDAGTGFNRHEDNAAVPTAVTEKDLNSLIWSMMEVVKAGGNVGIQFDETVPASYKLVAKALRAAYGGNVTTLNFANSPLVLTKDHAGLVLVDATAGNVSATLPAANVLATPLKLKFLRTDSTANSATMTCAGADALVGGGTSFILSGKGDHRAIESDATALWGTLAKAAPRSLASLTATVAANELTGALSGETLDFRSTALTSGVPVTRNAAAASLVVPSGATLGTIATVAARLVWGWIDNAGTLEPFVCNLSGGLNLDETTLISTTAISAAADSANVFYSTTARANVAFRVRGFCDITEAVAGTWATAPTLVQPVGGQALAALSSFGYGQRWQNLTGSRAVSVTYYNTTGRPIAVNISLDTTYAGTRVFNIDGVQVDRITCASTVNIELWIRSIVPPGAAYSFVGGGFTTWMEYR